MRILVTGREGQLARALSAMNAADLEVVCLGRPEMDVTNRASIDESLSNIRPDIVVNAAAYTAVDKAESDQAAAYAANATGAGNVAASAAASGIPVIHVSTDYVFSGEKTSPYVETDEVDPQSVYGASKLHGERAVAAANPAHIIVRTAWVYSVWGNNFLKTMLRLSQTLDEIGVVADQRGNPTYAPELARGLIAAARVALAAPQSAGWRGLFHLAGTGEAVWADFAEVIFDASAKAGGKSVQVKRISTRDYPTSARRPINSCLDCGKFQDVFGFSSPDWRTSTVECVADLNSLGNQV
jgi:dTDP-4-dehydrorhamnose reductase